MERPRWREKGKKEEKKRCGPAEVHGGDGVFLPNTRVLVTYIRTPSPPAVGLRRHVRIPVYTETDI